MSNSADKRRARKTNKLALGEIRKFVRRADPLGLGIFPDCRDAFPQDEYASYEMEVYRALLMGESQERIAKIISRGGRSDDPLALEVANEIATWWRDFGEGGLRETEAL